MHWRRVKHDVARADGLLIGRKPLARSEDLVIEAVQDEVLVYDRRSNRAHSLSATAADVWRACDGQTTAKALAGNLGLDTDSVARALEELADCALLEGEPPLPAGNGLTRRELTVRSARLGGAAAAAPLIFSVAVPVAQAQATPTPADCLQYNDKSCSACDIIAGCCCCCQGGGNCKLCYPETLCPSFDCDPGPQVDLGHCSTTGGTVPAGTVTCEEVSSTPECCGCTSPGNCGDTAATTDNSTLESLQQEPVNSPASSSAPAEPVAPPPTEPVAPPPAEPIPPPPAEPAAPPSVPVPPG